MPAASRTATPHAVVVGIGGHDDVGVLGFGLLDGELERLGVLGIGRLDRGEAAIADGLLFDDRILEPILVEQHRHSVNAGAMERRVDELDLVARGEDGLGLEHERGHGLAVDDVHLQLERDGLAGRLDGREQRGQRGGIGRELLELRGDAGGVRLDHLPAVSAVEFHAVVVRRIVAGGDHDAGLRGGGAGGEGELRRGAVLGEKERVDAEGVERLRGALGEGAGEVARVVGDDDLELLAGVAFEQVGAERGDGAVDVAEVEHVRPGAGELGAVERLGLALLGAGDDLADGAAAHAAGAEGDVAEEAVVELGPRRLLHELVDAGAVDRGRGRVVVGADDVLLGRGEELRGGFGGERERRGHIPEL